jgi:hypothetical protein
MVIAMIMATKAERFRARVQRSAAIERAAGSSARARRERTRPNDVHNLSARAGRKAEVKLEASQSRRPSRKSTRRSTNKGKLASNLERRQIRRTSSPKTRATRAVLAGR